MAMADMPRTLEAAQQEIEELRSRLQEMEDTIEAIRSGQVDAVVVSGPQGEQVYTLSGAERTYRILVEAMNEGALVLSPQGDIIYSNRTFAAMLGASVYEVLGHSLYEFVAESDIEPLRAMLEQVPEQGARHELRLRGGLSGHVPAFVSLGILDTEEGPSVSAVVTDLTEHKRTEAELERYREHLEELVIERTQELAESEQRVVTILDSIGDGFMAYDKDWRLVYLNPEGERQIQQISGLTREEIMDKVVWEGFPNLVNTELYSMYHKAVAEQTPYSFDYYFDRAQRWLRLRTFPSQDGLSVYSEDVTDSKQAEEALRLSEERYRRVVQNTTAVIIRCDAEANIVFANDRAFEFFGYSPDELIGRPALGTIIPEEETTGRDLTRMVREICRKPDAWHSNINENTRKNGERVWLEWTNSGICDSEGRLQGFLAVGIDITRRKKAEENLAAARAEAERKAAELESFIVGMSDGVVLHDANGIAILANDAAREILGIDPLPSIEERVKLHRVRKLDGSPMAPEETATGRAMTGEVVRDLRYMLTAACGQDKIISVSSSPVRSADGSILGATTILRDVTELVEFERQRDELFEREHHISSMLQEALIPPRVPQALQRLSISTIYQPALDEAQVGGDFFDVFDLDDNKIGVLIGDVAGKGLKAAIRVAEARYAVRSYAYIEKSPARVMTLVNDALCRESADTSNVLTMFFAVVDPASGTMTYASAGHEPPVICNPVEGMEELEVTGPMIGIIPGARYHERTRDLHQDDSAVLFTDGITEARRDSASLFDKTGVIEHLTKVCEASADEIAEALLEAATLHADGRLQDDVAIVVLGYDRG